MNRVAKLAIKISVSAIILLALIVGGGVAYIWYSGQNSVVNAVVPEVTPVKSGAISKPSLPEEDVNVGVSIQALTSPVVPGSNSSITVRTTPGATCVVSVIYDKTASADSGLKPKVADEYGSISWTWTVENGVPLGKWPVKITCSRNKKSGVISGDLIVVKTIEE